MATKGKANLTCEVYMVTGNVIHISVSEFNTSETMKSCSALKLITVASFPIINAIRCHITSTADIASLNNLRYR
jgi:hypothetical protein